MCESIVDGGGDGGEDEEEEDPMTATKELLAEPTDQWLADGGLMDGSMTHEGITRERYRNTHRIFATSFIATNEVWRHKRIYFADVFSTDKESGQR